MSEETAKADIPTGDTREYFAEDERELNQFVEAAIQLEARRSVITQHESRFGVLGGWNVEVEFPDMYGKESR